MKTYGDIMNEDDRERLSKWMARHPSWLAGLQADLALPATGFRTQGDVLYVSGDCAKIMRTTKIPARPDKPLNVVSNAQHQKSWDTAPDAE